MTNEDLRRKIGELLEYRIEWKPNRQYARLVAPDGTCPSERCWRDGWVPIVTGDETAHDAWSFSPDWPRDLNAASELMPVGCSLNRVDSDEWPGPWECTQITDYFTMDNITRYGDTPEMAICEWYVAALEAEAVSDG